MMDDQPVGVISITRISQIEPVTVNDPKSKHPWVFRLHSPDRIYMVAALSETEREDWKSNIEHNITILKKINQISSAELDSTDEKARILAEARRNQKLLAQVQGNSHIVQTSNSLANSTTSTSNHSNPNSNPVTGPSASSPGSGSDSSNLSSTQFHRKPQFHEDHHSRLPVSRIASKMHSITDTLGWGESHRKSIWNTLPEDEDESKSDSDGVHNDPDMTHLSKAVQNRGPGERFSFILPEGGGSDNFKIVDTWEGDITTEHVESNEPSTETTASELEMNPESDNPTQQSTRSKISVVVASSKSIKNSNSSSNRDRRKSLMNVVPVSTSGSMIHHSLMDSENGIGDNKSFGLGRSAPTHSPVYTRLGSTDYMINSVSDTNSSTDSVDPLLQIQSGHRNEISPKLEQPVANIDDHADSKQVQHSDTNAFPSRNLSKPMVFPTSRYFEPLSSWL